jgi:hypothetical protein
MCIDNQQMATFVMNMAKLKNLSFLKTIISTWTMSPKRPEWLIAIRLVREHGGEQKNFFTSWKETSSRNVSAIYLMKVRVLNA